MRIEKFVHSCLRLTLDGQRLLFDPGEFSVIHGRVDPCDLSGTYEFTKAMRPRHVILIHDGYARNYFPTRRYDTYQSYFERTGMTFHRLQQPGDGFDL